MCGGVDIGGDVFTYTGDTDVIWGKVDGDLSDIGAGADGVVWGVNSAGNIYRYIRD